MSSPNTMSRSPKCLVAFVLEQTLGHVTHSENMERLAPERLSQSRVADSITIEFLPVPFESDRFGRLPGWSNWTVRASVRAGWILRAATRRNRRSFDAIFIHTQVPATLLRRRMSKTPTVVSLDATPRQYDALGEFYQHAPGRRWAETLKNRLHRACFRRASHLVTWSSWARDDLVSSYGIDAGRISVIPPGVDVDRWTPRFTGDTGGSPLQVLFVGGDLQRKGGQLLIEACQRLRADPSLPQFELHLVTNAEVVGDEPGVTVHRGLTPNSAGLIERFRSADVFCLPTFGDCLPMVLAEAGACGLPIVSTEVGAISEIVQHGETGLLIPPGDGEGLFQSLHRLLLDSDLRERYGRAARDLVLTEHNAGINVGRIIDLVADAAKHVSTPPSLGAGVGHG
jgi:glycosyltransferase involved in cell wall biosynthesis